MQRLLCTLPLQDYNRPQVRESGLAHAAAEQPFARRTAGVMELAGYSLASVISRGGGGVGAKHPVGFSRDV